MTRYLVLLSAVVMQLCLGATYSWSVYVASLKAVTGISQAGVQLPFSFFYFVFPVTMVFSGSVLTRMGPRFSAMLGGLLFGSGWMMAGLGGYAFAFTVMGIGVIAGVGAGLAYIVPLSTAILWFPKQKGLVTGIAVAGFGGGAAIVSQVGGALMTHMGKTPFQVFPILGAVFLVLITLAGTVMKTPENDNKNIDEPEKNKGVSFSWMLAQPMFRILYFAMFSGLAAGFAVNANLKELHTASGVQAGVFAVSLFALANALGRISWGAFFDRVTPATAVKANLLCQAFFLILGALFLGSKTGFYLFALGTGFNYGGILVLYASSTALCWGDKRMGAIYGFLFSANIPAAVAPMAAGWIFEIGGSFYPAFIAIGVLLVVSIFLIPATFKSS
ncbi:MFS transporter, OFA family, oxalate/formate antiporter [Desulfocicer vacuolatum DSM 3385]|uniref:MFS transporter, OFA family, oxalate/formate antiporter n=1 Tax=Desulfocicer vacuolatum DSM 3385 TaxID=1121400 RepID=A0A1W2CLJ6_9BACT|nr:MFS transporter [Desulfocicer vacuolatum]SMC86070.1 MFS transporter, OFA family, oxalate/formate antiporter [Desulfocicer vacuolatum DSM 3385]